MERPFAELMGIEIRFAPDELAPPVDGDKLARYLCEALSPDETAEVCHLIGTFRCWYDACATLCRRGVNK